MPNAAGGHRILVRPDTYFEANLHPAHQGAEGAYNLLEGDVNGSLGSGASGRVVIDSGDPARGFKSYDWWGPIRAYAKGWSKEHTGETTSSLDWDRWTFKNLYVTGGDAGIFFDLTDKTGSPFMRSGRGLRVHWPGLRRRCGGLAVPARRARRLPPLLPDVPGLVGRRRRRICARRTTPCSPSPTPSSTIAL